tara:strand:- start:534 stop:788 length:255 start_codon:yes stop_codon:yes gene_type:complete
MTDIFIATFGGICLIISLVTLPHEKVSSEGLTEIEVSAQALEIYLQDKKDHKKYCPSKKWTQPSLEVYKEKLKSQLPEGCKDAL